MSEEKDVNTEVLASESQEEATVEAETKTEATQSDVDYQKELEMARQELEKKNKQIGQAEHVIETLKKEGGQATTDNIEDVVNRLVEEKVSHLTEKVRGDKIENLVSAYASSTDEAELIKFHLQNSIKQSGDDVTDIINAKAIANKARFQQQTAEIKRAQNVPEAEKVTSAGQKPAKADDLKLSPEEQKIMRQFGVTKDDLQNGVR